MDCSDGRSEEKEKAKKGFIKINKITTEVNQLDFHIDQEIFHLNVKKSAERERKLSLLRNFEKRVSALRNSGGGILFVHICNRSGNNIRLSDFDQLVDRGLKNLIADGSLFVESYSRKWLSNCKGFEAFTNIIILTVSKSSCVSTVVFNTKVTSDLEVEHPNTFDLGKLICKTIRSVDTRQEVEPFVRREDDWNESRHIQLKTFHLPTFRKFSQDRPSQPWAQRFVDFVWSRLRFSEYLSCMTKVPGGGNYIVGVTEASGSNPVNIHGVKLEEPESSIRQRFTEKLAEVQILNLKPNQSFDPVQDDIINISFRNITRTRNVYVEINVKFLPGIVFDNGGPQAYKIIPRDRTIVRMKNMDWLDSIRKLTIE